MANNTYSAVYTSTATGNWSSTATWDLGAVPGDGDDVVIANTHVVDLDVNSATISTLTIDLGGTLQPTTVSSTFNVNVTGNVDVNGTYNGLRGGGEFMNLIVHGNSTLTVGGTFDPTYFTIGPVADVTLAQSITSANGLSGQEDILVYGTLNTDTYLLTLNGGDFSLFADATLQLNTAGGVTTVISGGTSSFDPLASYILGNNVTDTGFGTITDVHDINFVNCTISTSTDLTISGSLTETGTSSISLLGGGDTWTLTGNETGDNGLPVNIDNLVVNATYNGFGRTRIGNTLTIGAAGDFTASNSVEFIFSGGATVTNSGNLSVGTIRPLGNLSSNGTISINGLTDIAGTNWTHSAGTVTANGTDAFSAGTYDFANLTIAGTWTSTNDITIQGTFNVTGSFIASAGTVTLTGPDIISGAGTITLNNLTINGDYSQTASLVTVNGDIDIDTHTYDVVTNSLILNDGIVFTTGDLDLTENASSLTIGGTGALTLTNGIFISNEVGNLTITRTGATTTYNTSLTVDGTLTLNNGGQIFDVVGTLTLNGGFTATAGTLDLDGVGERLVIGATASTSAYNSTDFENSTIYDLYIDRAVTWTNDLTITNDLDIENGLADFQTITLNINGSSINLNAGGSFESDVNGLVNFPNTTSLTNGGVGTYSFYDIDVSGVLNYGINITITGDLNVTGTLNNSGGTTTFDNVAQRTITNSGTLDFENMAVATGSDVTTTSSFDINGDLTMNGTGVFLTADPSEITFSDANAVITMSSNSDGATTGLTMFDVYAQNNLDFVGAFDFYLTDDITADPSSTVTMATGSRIIMTSANGFLVGTNASFVLDQLVSEGSNRANGDIYLNSGISVTAGNVFNQSANTLFLDGATIVLDNQGTTLSLNDVVVNSPDVTIDDDFTIKGDMTVNVGGSFIHSDNILTITGTGSFANSGLLEFHDVRVLGSPTSTADITIGGDFTVDPTYSWISSLGEITFDGATSTIDNQNTLEFYDLAFAASVTNCGTDDSFEVTNNLTMNGNANFIAADPSDITFSGGGNITTSANADGTTVGLNLHDVSFTGGYVTVGSNTIQVSGNFDVTGGFTGGTNSTIYFSGTTGTITDAGTLDFSSIEIGSNATGTYFTTTGFDVAENFRVEDNGYFYTNTTILFEGSSGTISGGANNNADNIVFQDIEISSSSLGATASYTVNGDFNVLGGGQLVSTGGAVHFRDGITHSISNLGGLVFWDLVIDDGNSITTTSNFVVDGDNFVVGGSSSTFLATAGEVSFTGSSGTITNNADEDNLQFYDFETDNGGNIDLNEDDSFNVYNDARIIGGSVFTCYGDSRVTFNGIANQDLNIISSEANFRDLYLESGFELNLSTDIQLNEFNVYDDLVLVDGTIDLNGDNIITMHAPDANLIESPEQNVVYNSNTNATALGHIYYSENFTSRVDATDLYGLGLGIQQSLSANPMGNTIIRRYHANLEPSGGLSIRRYFEIDNDNTNIDASIVLNYFEDELNSIPEETMIMLSTQSIFDTWAVRDFTPQVASNRYVQTDSVFQFADFSRIFTLAEPLEFVLDSNFIGLTDTNNITNRKLIAGQTEYQVFGFSVVAEGNVQLDSISIQISDNSEGQLKNFKLMYSQNSVYDEDDALPYTDPISSGDGQLSFIQTIDISSEVEYYFYLFADVEDNVTIESPNVDFYINQSQIYSPNAVGVVREIQGPSYGFQQRIDAIFNPIGITQPTLYPEDEDVVIYGFELQPLGNDASLSEFRLVFENDNFNAFTGNVEVFRSSDDNYLSTDDNLQVDISSNVTLGETDYIDIVFDTEQLIDADGQYYFIKIDSVSTNADEDSPNLRPGIPHQSLVSSQAAPILTDTVFGIEYDFAAISARIIAFENIAEKNIIAGIRNQSIFGFTIESNQPTSLENITFELSLIDLNISDITQISIYIDNNENGLADSDELLDQIIPSSSVVSFNDLPESEFEGEKQFLITISLISTTEVGSTLFAQIQDASFVELRAPAVLDAGGPFEGNIQTVISEGVVTQVNLENIYPSTVISGEEVTLTLIARDANGNISRLDENEDITFSVSGTDVTISGNTSTQMQKDEYFETATGVVLSSVNGDTEAILQTTPNTFSIDRDTLVVFKSAPTSSPGDITLSDGLTPTSSINIDSWTNGNGDGRIIVARLGNTPKDPINGIYYSAITNFNNIGAVGTNQTDAGSVVIYNNIGNSFPFEISNLMAGQNYYFRIYEYNLSNGVPIYYIPSDIETYVYQTTAASEAFSGNNDSTNAAVIPEDFAFTGQLTSEIEEDWYFYNLNEDYMQINTCIENKVIEVYYQQGNELILLRVQDNFEDNCNYILLNNADHGKYYIRVFSADSEILPNDYSLKITSWTEELFSKTECDCPK